MSERKILGVLGGMGPLATCEFLRGIVEHTDASCDQEHLDVLTYSHASLPNRTDAVASGDAGGLRDQLVRDAVMLERCGAGVLAIPCNNTHVFYDDIQAAVKIPVIHMIRETIARVGPSKTIGVLAAEGTVKADIYGKEGVGVRVVYPVPEVQRRVTDIIQRVKSGGRMDSWALRIVAEEMAQQKCDHMVLGCTELSCAARGGPRESGFIDAMDVLIWQSVTLCGGVYKE